MGFVGIGSEKSVDVAVRDIVQVSLLKHSCLSDISCEFADSLDCSHETAGLGMSSMSQGKSVLDMVSAFSEDVFPCLEGCSACTAYLLGWDKFLVVFTSVSMAGLALD